MHRSYSYLDNARAVHSFLYGRAYGQGSPSQAAAAQDRPQMVRVDPGVAAAT